MTKAEETIIQELIAEEKAEVIWDLDQYFYQDPHHSAAYFIRKYTKQWAFLNQNPSSELSNHFSESKQIEIINVSKLKEKIEYIFFDVILLLLNGCSI